MELSPVAHSGASLLNAPFLALSLLQSQSPHSLPSASWVHHPNKYSLVLISGSAFREAPAKIEI